MFGLFFLNFPENWDTIFAENFAFFFFKANFY